MANNSFVNFFLTAPERIALSRLAKSKWSRFYLQGGAINNVVKKGVYSIGALLIECDSPPLRTLIELEIKELEEGSFSELFRFCVVDDDRKIEALITSKWNQPPWSELNNAPDNFDIMPLISETNKILLLTEEFFDNDTGVAYYSDSGLLFVNSEKRMALYPSIEIPLDICITTDADIVEKITNKAYKTTTIV